MVQTVPPYPTPVCPGGRLVLTCMPDNPNYEAVVWIGDSNTEGHIGTSDNPLTVDSFNVTAGQVNGVFVSYATNESVPVQLNGTNISCSGDFGLTYAAVTINITGIVLYSLLHCLLLHVN